MPSRKKIGEQRNIVAFSYKFRPEIPISISAPEEIVNAWIQFLKENNPTNPKTGEKKVNWSVTKHALKFLLKELELNSLNELNKYPEIKALNQQYLFTLCKLLKLKDSNLSKFHTNKFLKPLLNEAKGYNF